MNHSFLSGFWGRRRSWYGWVGCGVVVSAIAIPLALTSPLATLSWQGWLTLAAVLFAFYLNAFTSTSAEVAFLGALAGLLITGVLDTEAALAGFSNDGLVTVGVLYIVVSGLQQTGALAGLARHALGLPKRQSTALLRLMLPIMGLSAFLNNTPVVALFIPVVTDWCRKLNISPSKLMIPLSFGAIFGGICTLIGTSTNLVVNGLLVDATDHPGLRMFDIAWVGLPCGIAGCAMLYFTQSWLLPDRKPIIGDRDDMRHYTTEMVVPHGSPLVGKSVEQAGLRHLPGLYLVEIVRGDDVLAAVGPRERLQENDQLVFVGVVDSVLDLQRLQGLQPATTQVFKLSTPRTERCLIEAVVSDTCPLVGRSIREGQFRSRYQAVVLAVARNGARLGGKLGDIRLRPGDTLLVEADPAFTEQQRISRDFYLVSALPNSEPLRHEKAPIALIALIAMVGLAGLGWLSMLKAAVLAAVVMVVTGCCSPGRAMRAIDWSVLLVIGAALGISTAMATTGAAEALSATFMGAAGSNRWLALAVIYGVTTLLTEIVTNNAAAALMFPIALSLSETLGVSYLPFTIVIMMGASASFLTPIGYQTNLMVYGPGGYRFSDFIRVGLPLNLLFWVLTVAITPLVFPF